MCTLFTGGRKEVGGLRFGVMIWGEQVTFWVGAAAIAVRFDDCVEELSNDLRIV